MGTAGNMTWHAIMDLPRFSSNCFFSQEQYCIHKFSILSENSPNMSTGFIFKCLKLEDWKWIGLSGVLFRH